jgi:hypothetical protein
MESNGWGSGNIPMKIPVFSRIKAIDKEGNFTPSMQQVFDILFQQMQKAISDDGIEVPQLDTNSINNVSSESNANSKPNGTIWYDTDAKKFKGKEDGVVKVFTLS